MLIIVSDLHFTDGSAGVHHLTAEAFQRTFQDLAHRARRARARDIKLVLLGDIYDMVRTERWFDVEPDHRPWGRHPSEDAAVGVFDHLVERNKDAFELLSGSMVDQFGFPVEPERVFVPGNHDRLCALYPSLRRRVRETLGLPPTVERFDHVFVDLDHGTLGRHAQEWDAFNFEGSDAFAAGDDVRAPAEEYLSLPIGDVIASEFAAKLPLRVLETVRDERAAERLYQRFKNLFDVRPLVAMTQWLAYQSTRNEEYLRTAINEAVRMTTEDFERIPFVQWWIAKHDEWSNPLDEADRLQMLMFMLETFRFSDFDRSLDRLDRAETNHDVEYAFRAVEDFRRLDRDPDLRGGMSYVVYGHTHLPEQRPVGLVGRPPNERERMYVNAGTWRPVHRQGISKTGFVSWKNVTYTLVYRPGERLWGDQVAGFPSLETWTGAIKDA